MVAIQSCENIRRAEAQMLTLIRYSSLQSSDEPLYHAPFRRDEHPREHNLLRDYARLDHIEADES